MKKRLHSMLLVLCLVLGLVACAKAPTWQEQYDLGVRYLSEGNYEEAIIAFTAAIEIDPKRPEAYGGLANTYMAMGEYEKADAVWKNIPIDISETSLERFSMWQDKSDEIRTALEGGESGLWIMDCSFDKDTFIEGKETRFDLTAFYSCPEGGKYNAALYANMNESFRRTDIGNDVVISGGVGVLQLSAAVVPVFWNGVYFNLSVDLWEGDDWEWVCGDDVYLTPEGELSGNYAPLNAYGGTEFACRRDYQAFDTLDIQTQERVAALAKAAVAGNTEMLLSLASVPGFNGKLYTVWNGYKIEIDDDQEWHYNEDANAAVDKAKGFTIQLRPENGIGYYCHVNDSETKNPAGKDSWLDYSMRVRIVSCPCVGWQWNGVVSVKDYNDYFWRDSEGITCHTVETISVNGTVVDGLWEGKAVETKREVADWNWTGENHFDDTYTTTRVYQSGVLIEVGGEPWGYGKGYHFIGDYDGGGSSYSNQQDFLDECYW